MHISSSKEFLKIVFHIEFWRK